MHSILYPGGGFSHVLASVDGKTGEPLDAGELFKAWGIMAHVLAQDKMLGAGRRYLCEYVHQAIKAAVTQQPVPIPPWNFNPGDGAMQQLIEALQIMLKYGNPESPTHCEHDELTVMIDPELVSAEDIKKLDELGFSPNYDKSEPDFDIENHCEGDRWFRSFKYGSA